MVAGSTVLVVNVTAATTVTRAALQRKGEQHGAENPVHDDRPDRRVHDDPPCRVRRVQAPGRHGNDGERESGNEREQHRRPTPLDAHGERAQARQR
jgi:hypothetical protein